MGMKPHSLCAPKLITPLPAPHLHTVPKPLILPECQASGLLQRGDKFQSSLPVLVFPPQNVHPGGTADEGA